jgi:hypothetical protein
MFLCDNILELLDLDRLSTHLSITSINDPYFNYRRLPNHSLMFIHVLWIGEGSSLWEVAVISGISEENVQMEELSKEMIKSLQMPAGPVPGVFIPMYSCISSV